MTAVPSWVADAVFYEIVPDRFAPPRPETLAPYARDAFDAWEGPGKGRAYRGGNLEGIVERLDWLVDLGVTALYLTPIHVSSAYHRYKPIDHLHVDPLLGGDPAFAALLESAHARGLKIVLDGVFNHVGIGFRGFVDVMDYGPESPWRDWFHIRSWPVRVVDPPNTPSYVCWNNNPTMPKLNIESSAVQEYILLVAEAWARRGIDGWRFDAASEMGPVHSFWREMRRRLRAINPDIYLLGEYWLDPSAWLDGQQWDGATNYPLAFAIRDFVGGEVLDPACELPGRGPIEPVDAPELARRIEHLIARHPIEHLLGQLNFVDNHDLARFLTAVRGDRARAALAELLLFAAPGPPCVYYGAEVGLEGGLPPDATRGYPSEANWDLEARARFKRLIALRRSSAALRRGDWRMLHAQDRTIAFTRTFGEESALVAVNAGERTSQIVLPTMALGGPFVAIGAAVATGTSDAVHLALGPLSGCILGASGQSTPNPDAVRFS